MLALNECWKRIDLTLRPKSNSEIETIRQSSKILSKVLLELKKIVAPGVTTKELDSYAQERLITYGAKPAFKGYLGYPATLCTSINEVIVHGIPSVRKLNQGDIISLDLGACLDGYYSDAAITLPVGNITESAQKLIEVTRQSLYKGISQACAGARLSNISHAVQVYVESFGYSVVKVFVGHGIGKRQQ